MVLQYYAMISNYEDAKEIAQDRANRGKILMYIFKIKAGGYYLTTQYEYPFVDRDMVETVEEIWPQEDWLDVYARENISH